MLPRNQLISRLPDDCRQDLLAQCEQIDLEFGEIVYRAGAPIDYVYFPIDSIISLILPTESSPELEVGLVGREGMLGIPLILGIDAGMQHGLVQSGGLAWRLEAEPFAELLNRNPLLKHSLERYLVAFMHQLAQGAACIRFHPLEARLARWLLMAHDRACNDELQITQEFVARRLGVRRVGITQAARTLRQRRLISYSRGRIRVLDRRGLEATACGCYRVITQVYSSLLGEIASVPSRFEFAQVAAGDAQPAAK